MIRVLVAEDEQPILRSTCTLIERLNPSFKVVSRVGNGKEVLEDLKNMEIDFMVLDIQMPVMTGLEVLKKMEEDNIHIPTVILSGFQNFQYVRSAMRFGVIDYLLKPIKKEELSQVLDHASDLVWRKRSQQKPNHVVKEFQEEYEIALCVLGSYYLLPEDYELCQEQEKMGKEIQKVLKGMLPEESRWIIPGRYPNEQLIVFRKLGNRSENVVRKLYQSFMRGKIPVTIIFNREIQNHKSIYDSNIQMRKKMKMVMEIEQSVLCFYEQDYGAAENLLQIERGREFVKGIQLSSQILPSFENALQQVNRRSVILEILKEGFLEICGRIECQFPYMEIEEELNELVQSCYSKSELLDKLDKLIICSFLQKEQKSGKKQIALQIKEYLDYFYKDEITNQTLSDRFGFVSAYLRDVFKREYKLSPMEYLQNIRLEKSSKMLIENTNMSIKDIAESVGFIDSLYYSKVFRKKWGISPSRYRGLKQEG